MRASVKNNNIDNIPIGTTNNMFSPLKKSEKNSKKNNIIEITDKIQQIKPQSL